MRITTMAFLCLATVELQANVIQYFTGISYSNPSELFQVKKNDFFLGGTIIDANGKFNGSSLNFNTFQYESGQSISERTSFLPYGRVAQRVNDKWVVGLDVTQPIHSNLAWGENSVTRYAGINNLLRDIDISPRFSYQFKPGFYAGAGANFNFIRKNETDWALPTGPTSYATLINLSSGFGLGYDLGLYYSLNPTNFVGLTYYSTIRQRTRGTSTLADNVNTNYNFSFHLPSTLLFNYLHFFNQTWLINLQAIQSAWSENQIIRIHSTATPGPFGNDYNFPVHYKKSWTYAAAIHHQLHEKLGLTLLSVLDNGPERWHLRTINLPADKQYFFALVSDYHLNKTTTFELLYGYGFLKTKLSNQVTVNAQAIPFNTGRVHIHANVVDLRLKIQV